MFLGYLASDRILWSDSNHENCGEPFALFGVSIMIGRHSSPTRRRLALKYYAGTGVVVCISWSSWHAAGERGGTLRDFSEVLPVNHEGEARSETIPILREGQQETFFAMA